MLDMSDYVGKCWEDYLSHRSPVMYVRCVFDEAKKRAKGKDLISKATKALVELSRKKSPDDFISLQELQQYAGITRTTSTGLWIWLKGPAAVVEKQPGVRAYRIRNEFYEAFQRLFDREVVKPARHCILELQGLGKEVWAGIDAQAYVDRERSAWAG